MSGLGTLRIHVGTHKTGTTSIQEGLYLCKEALETSGLACYPAKNAWKLANVFIRPTLQTAMRQAGRAVVPDGPEFDAQVAAMRAVCMGPHPDVIVSAEAFCFLREECEAEALRTMFTPLFSQIIPIIVFRNMGDWRALRHNQLAKTATRGMQSNLPGENSVDGEWYYDPEAIMAFWANFAPVTVIDYDAAMAADGSILPEFAAAIQRFGLFDGLDLRLNARG